MGLMTRLEKPTNQPSHINNVSFHYVGVVGRPRVFWDICCDGLGCDINHVFPKRNVLALVSQPD
jgi:hypothetical protein